MALTQVKTTGIADDAVTQDKVANDAIDLTEIKAGVDGKIISYDASGNPVAVGPGTDGQVLTSTGAGAPPAFEDAAGGPSLANDANNRVITGTGSGLNGEANLTFDGNHLTQTIDANAEGFNQTAAGAHYIDNIAEANLSSGDNPILRTTATWNGTTVAQIKYNAGADTTNKDDGYLSFNTSAADDLSERMRITSSGTIGINTTSPQYQFEVDTTATEKTSVGFSANGESADVRFRSNNVNEAGVIRVDESSGGGIMNFWNKTTGGTLTHNLEIQADGDVQVKTGNLIIGTSGKGIDFSAAGNAAGMTSELLDDYEEGTYTPALTAGNGSFTHTTQQGNYVKIGRLVFCTFRCDWSSCNATAQMYVSTPFTSTSGNEFGQTGTGGVSYNGSFQDAYSLTIGMLGSNTIAKFYARQDDDNTNDPNPVTGSGRCDGWLMFYT